MRLFRESKIVTTLRAACVAEWVIAHAVVVRQEMVEKVSSPTGWSSESQRCIEFALQCVFLLQAQRVFWERIIKDDDIAQVFERELFAYYERRTACKPYVKMAEYVRAIQESDSANEVKFVGTEVCRVLGVQLASVQYAATVVFVSSLEPFHTQLMQISKWSKSEMEKMLREA